jgi:acetolactate synthase-1/2/3 large subunit
MTVSDLIAEFLKEKGCKHAFGFVGGGNATLFHAISQRLEMVCHHHEQAAAMAASYYQRIAGGVGVCIVTSGAGSANAITGAMAAQMDGIPLLILSGNEKSYTLKDYTRIRGVQGYDSAKLADGFCKAGLRIMAPGMASETIEEAYKTALDHRQGAVWLDVPVDMQRARL